jgi:hypothetical protein
VTDEEFDKLLDNLPNHARNKVLETMGGGEHRDDHFLEGKRNLQPSVTGRELAAQEKANNFLRSLCRMPLWILAFMWAVVCLPVGVVCMATIIGIPIGLLLWAVGTYPLRHLIAIEMEHHQQRYK